MENWDNLRYFLAVAKAGTVKAAADKMGVSHTTVLRRIDLFEREMESKLFKRLQSGYELTAFGHSVVEGALKVRHEIEQLELQIKGQDLRLEGSLRISQPENDVINLYPVYAEFSRLYPQITLKIASSVKISNLNRHEVDVAIRFSESPQDLLVGRCVGRLDFGIYGSKDYLKKFDGKAEWEDLDWILLSYFSKKEEGPMVQDGWLAKRVKNPKVILRTTSSSGIINAIRAGMGVGFLSSHTAKQYPELIPLPLDEPAFSLKLWALTHQDLRHTAMVRVFMQHFADALGNQLS